MCSAFEIKSSSLAIADMFDLPLLPPLPNIEYIRPTDFALIIGMGNEGKLLKWGFEVSWSKQPLINARSETLLSKSIFKNQLGNRCLIPASAYCEWRKDSAGHKKKNHITNDHHLFVMAGLVNEDTFTIITCEASRSIRHIHGRMPVILSKLAAREWITPSKNYADVSGTLAPYTKNLSSEEEPQNQSTFNWSDP